MVMKLIYQEYVRYLMKKKYIQYLSYIKKQVDDWYDIHQHSIGDIQFFDALCFEVENYPGSGADFSDWKC